ncbi:MAG: hypothetical protein P8Q99_03060 [Paracoccaceae bacterium]|nr:hypothetical protein [Paracoccaceae bacterium]
MRLTSEKLLVEDVCPKVEPTKCHARKAWAKTEAVMAKNERDGHQSEFAFSDESSAPKRELDRPVQTVHNSIPLRTKVKPEDLGRPPMGWMPRNKVIALVQKIDAGLSHGKGV